MKKSNIRALVEEYRSAETALDAAIESVYSRARNPQEPLSAILDRLLFDDQPLHRAYFNAYADMLETKLKVKNLHGSGSDWRALRDLAEGLASSTVTGEVSSYRRHMKSCGFEPDYARF